MKEFQDFVILTTALQVFVLVSRLAWLGVPTKLARILDDELKRRRL